MVLEGIKNLLLFVNNNWATIVVISGACVAIYRKVKIYRSLSDEEKKKQQEIAIDLAWKAVSESMLSMVSDAESNWLEWAEAGSIKRSEVINRIFKEYPILGLIADRDEVINRIDELIKNALVEMRKIFEQNVAGSDQTESE